jgi:hypothetical protein
MPQTTISTEVVGIKALTKDLLRVADEHSGQLLPFLQAAAERAMAPIANAVRSSLPHRSGRLAASVRVARSRTGASVREGDGLLYAGPVDFGGWPPGRPYLPNGRYLFPAAGNLSGQAERIYNQAVATALDHIQWTNETSSPEAVHD